MARGSGVDAGESMMVEGGQNISEEIRDAQTAPSVSILQRAVVVEVINDLAIRDEEQWEELKGQLSNPDLLDSTPRNSIIARVVSGGQDKRSPSAILCYPFFPPYLCFPLKAGEQVWLINESPDDVANIGYWMCRIPEPDFVDDLNFTHGDRKFDVTAPPGTKEKADNAAASSGEGEGEEGEEGEPPHVPTFVNGTGQADGFSLSEEEAYEMFFTGSIANLSFTPEAVPRFTKRAGDLVLQGSNNTLICLGEDRGWGKEAVDADLPEAEDSNASKTEEEAERTFAGTIDMVVGRGRFPPENPTTADAEGDDPELTAARLIENERGFIETDKHPVCNSLADSNRVGDAAEGDPDFVNDMSRIYVSMNTDGDDMFGLTDNMPGFVPTAGGGGAGGGPADGGGGPFDAKEDVEPVLESPYIIIKSDEIRIIARYDEENEINGSIKIIKEGEPDDVAGKGRAAIIIQPDGSVLIDAPRIVLAPGDITASNDEADFLEIGHEAQESMILGNTLSFYLDKFCNTAMPEIGNLGGPLVNLQKACLDLKADLAGLKHLSTMAKLK
jgi:hypothetical protein